MVLYLLQYLDELKISTQTEKKQIWDPCRKKWVALTPEEMVRQLFIVYLTHHRGIRLNHIGSEKEIKLEKTRKRFDLILYSPDLKPAVLVECKAPEIELNESVIAQVVRYNRILSVGFLVVVNGQECRVFKSSPSSWEEQDEFPTLV